MSGSSSSPVVVTGAVADPLTLTPTEVASLPSTSVTVNVNGTSEVYSGVSVYNLLTAASFEHSAAKNGALQDYIQVTNAGGQSVVLSEGEVDPSFGGASSTDIIAYSENGSAIAPTLIVPGDLNGGIGGRDLGSVTTLSVGEATIPSGPFTSQAPYPNLTIAGNIPAPVTETLSSVEALPATTQTDTFLSGTASKTYTFTGTPLYGLLQSAGLDTTNQAQVLDEYTVVTGSDGYSTVYSLGEIDPAYRSGPVALVAYDDGTGPYPSISGNGGVFRSTAPGDSKGGRYDSNIQEITVAVACFCQGTRILSESGDVPVEQLPVGIRVVTARGALAPVRWIGRRSYAGRFLRANPQVQPIRFAAGSLGAGLPQRDLLVSPKHAMFLDGVLVPADCLVNGSSIVEERGLDRVDYFHVELDTHDILIAEGAPSESFHDDNSRGMFHNVGEFEALYPDGLSRDGYCAPRVEDGEALETIRRRLAIVAEQAAA